MFQISPMQSKIRIKKHKNKNTYLFCENMWIRNFTQNKIKSIDINQNYIKGDFDLFLKNEVANIKNKNLLIDNESSKYKKAVIVSDGLFFNEKQFILSELNYKDVAIIGVNGTLTNWKMIKGLSDKQRIMNYYLINNPYDEAKYFLPNKHKYYPKCIASIRTNPNFIEEYQGSVYYYTPVKNEYYSGVELHSNFPFDDYRNPICAAICFAYKLGVEKLLLLCCDDSFKNHRPGAVKVDEYWTYPQHIMSNNIIDSQLHWIKNKMTIKHHCCGLKFNNSSYINYEDIYEFFNQDGEG